MGENYGFGRLLFRCSLQSSINYGPLTNYENLRSNVLFLSHVNNEISGQEINV
jgi:hypothetical protein